jgi:hypothetical protein
MLHCRGRLGSDHARFLRSFTLARKRRRYPKASSIPAAVARPIVGTQWVCHGLAGSLGSYASYCHPLTLVDPNLTLTRAQHPAIGCNAGNKKQLTYAGFAIPCKPQQPLTAHS